MKSAKNIDQAKFERIEAYLLDKMTPQEASEFEKEFVNNAELRKEVKVQADLILAVETGEMIQKLEQIHQRLHKKTGLGKWYVVAASVVILLAVGVWAISKPSKTGRLFATYVTVEPGLPVPMSATDNYTFYDAMVDYKTEKYELAVKKWKPLLSKDQDNDTLNYFIGVAYFNQEDYAKAIPFFERTIQTEQSVFNGKAEWYLALSFLKTKNFDGLMELASKSDSEFSDRINEMTQKIE